MQNWVKSEKGILQKYDKILYNSIKYTKAVSQNKPFYASLQIPQKNYGA